MALSNYEKQKRWREKHRALYNLQQRNRRNLSRQRTTIMGADTTPAINEASPIANGLVEKPPAQFSDKIVNLKSKDETLQHLRKLVEREQSKLAVVEPVKPVVRRSPTGMVISEAQWEKRREDERIAKEEGWQPDEYSQ